MIKQLPNRLLNIYSKTLNKMFHQSIKYDSKNKQKNTMYADYQYINNY